MRNRTASRLRWLLAFLLVMGGAAAMAAQKGPQAPWVLHDETGDDRCSPGDPQGPCRGRVLTVSNPLGVPVKVTVSCGATLMLDLDGEIPAHSSAIFDVGTDRKGGLYPGDCYLAAWWKLKR